MLSNNLTAYRKGQSCKTSLIGLVERWKQAVDNRNVVGVLSTDMSKAFDSLYPPLLINKLRAYGFSNDSLALMRSYFRDRKYRMRISQNASSGWYTTTRGCPQAYIAKWYAKMAILKTTCRTREHSGRERTGDDSQNVKLDCAKIKTTVKN